MITIAITAADHCRSVESLLRTRMPRARRSFVSSLVRSGKATLNGLKASPGDPVFAGDSVGLKESDTVRHYLADMLRGLDILHEDDRWIMVSKPPGLPMHRTAESEGDLVEEGERFMAERGTPCRLYPVNRLDRGTSGAVILAKSSQAAGILGRYVKETGLGKLYLSLCLGTAPENGEIDEPLDGKESVTLFSRISCGERCSLLAVTPRTGRMHQIRRHLADAGHPVLGDRRYGTGILPGLPGFALHSFITRLDIPEHGSMTACAPLPEGFFRLCVGRGIPEETILKALKGLLQEPAA